MTEPYATLSLDALALERLPVIVTGLPDVQLWPALTAWSDLCARAPHLGRVFGGTSRVFYHDIFFCYFFFFNT